MRLAISGQLLGKTRSLPEILDLFSSLGVDAIELWPENLPGATTSPGQSDGNGETIAGVRATLDRSGIAAACLTLGGGALKRCRDDGHHAGTEALTAAIDAAVAVGAPLVNCYLADLPPSLFVAAVQPAAAYAGRRGVTIVLENEAHDDSGPAHGVASIVEAVASPYFGTVYDPCNYYQANDEPFPGAYEVVKDHVRYVHLKGGCRYDPARRPTDHRGGTLRGHDDAHIAYVPLPEGAVNVDGVLRRLAADGYNGFVTLEPHVPPDQALAFYQVEVPYLRALIAQASPDPARAPSAASSSGGRPLHDAQPLIGHHR